MKTKVLIIIFLFAIAISEAAHAQRRTMYIHLQTGPSIDHPGFIPKDWTVGGSAVFGLANDNLRMGLQFDNMRYRPHDTLHSVLNSPNAQFLFAYGIPTGLAKKATTDDITFGGTGIGFTAGMSWPSYRTEMSNAFTASLFIQVAAGGRIGDNYWLSGFVRYSFYEIVPVSGNDFFSTKPEAGIMLGIGYGKDRKKKT